ncbi:unnamed protein product [Acanthoscelides obtectus]|uniref:Uncharacterized protein n=1 Tax=Acanthoscelides obtectus TaxID=200917 RepID=A0A9P0QGT0_ACAOB|nr:unnamed protein product [Acanthoscelides obtectus]CAK1689500.1 hypothetical protein AOBTE_LOCUS37305 [Acanthoscelides obtectus]
MSTKTYYSLFMQLCHVTEEVLKKQLRQFVSQNPEKREFPVLSFVLVEIIVPTKYSTGLQMQIVTPRCAFQCNNKKETS